MFAVGNEELNAAPELGETIKCLICGEVHEVEYGDLVKPDGTKAPTKMLAFFSCGDKSYLCGIDGKDIRRRGNDNTDTAQ
jgi:hypothetical protein